jgi:signal transduction histidine kinase
VDHLLDVSRINAGRMSISPEPTDIKTLVEDVIASCQLTTTRHTISLVAPAQVQAVADPVRIEQVVTNLVDNAIKYSPSGGAIELQLEHAENEVVLCVRDHGLGIPADRLGRLFERFYRAHTNQQVSGMGLGLFISQHIVELHGGSIQVESPADEQGGTRFTIHLPLRAHDLH